MNSGIKLLTGIPRSGTTLCCKLINTCPQALALHEPIDPMKIPPSADKPSCAVKTQIHSLREKLQKGEPFEHGDKKNLVLDNPIAQNTLLDDGKRALKAQRGMLTLSPIANKTQLFIKQNAMFAALSKDLSGEFRMIAIVRNPIDVLTSWMSVDLPVATGRIPGGERFCTALKKRLDTISTTIDRQLFIYHWFIKQYLECEIPVLKYEDIIKSKGASLFEACGLAGQNDSSLIQRHAYKPEFESILSYVTSTLDYELLSPFYSRSDVEHSLIQTTQNCGGE